MRLVNPMQYDENGNVLSSSEFASTGFAVGDLGEADQNWANAANTNIIRHL